MGLTVDHQRTSSTDSFTTVMVEYHGQLVLADESFVEHIKHFEERCFIADLGHDVILKVTLVGRT